MRNCDSLRNPRGLALRLGLLAGLALMGVAGDAPVRTMRLDFFHTGSASEETFALDSVSLEGPWAGRPDRAIDNTNLGKYFFEVVDRATNRTVYSRGFASIFGEWESTEEARKLRRGFHESLRFPCPRGPVQISLKKRDAENAFREIWSIGVDPNAQDVDRSAPPANVKVWPVMKNGEPSEKVDLLLIGDGYTAAEMAKWHNDAKRLCATLFTVSPFKENKSRFNVWAIDVAAEESGVSRPSNGVWRKSPVRAGYDAFGSERYILTMDNKRFREIASAAPYDFVEIVTNGRIYGGGGIFNLFATVSSDNASTPYVFVHEFGHHFAGLADEYYTSDVAYGSPTGRPEPWEPNVTADPKAARWKDLITATAMPTPWPKEEFEKGQNSVLKERRRLRAEKRPEEEMEQLMGTELVRTKELLSRQPHGGKVGAFEGAMYEGKGYYRPSSDCIMFTRNMDGFCAVCRRAIARVIDQYAK